MALGVVTNISSLAAQRSLAETSRVMETAMERLSSGKRINSAADDASGVATVARMTAQIGGLNQAVRNANDGQAMVQAVEAGLTEVGDILQRLRSLAVQAATDSTSSSDRTYLNDEKTALMAEIDRIASKTKFNGINTLDGTLAANLQIGYEADDTVSLAQTSVATTTLGGFINQQGSIGNASGTRIAASSAVANRSGGSGNETYTIQGHVGSATTAAAASGDTAKDIAGDINAKTSETGVFATAKNAHLISSVQNAAALTFTLSSTDSGSSNGSGTVSVTDGTDFAALTKAINTISASTGITATNTAAGIVLLDEDGSDIVIARSDTTAGNVIIKALKSDLVTTAGTAAVTTTSTNVHARLEGMIDLHSTKSFEITANGDATEQHLASAAVSATSLTNLSLTSRSNANTAITLLDGAIETLASHKASLGAIDNRLSHTVSNLMEISEATSAARSRVEDADFAVESANLAKAQVLMQAGTAMLAQANSSQQLVLQLIQ